MFHVKQMYFKIEYENADYSNGFVGDIDYPLDLHLGYQSTLYVEFNAHFNTIYFYRFIENKGYKIVDSISCELYKKNSITTMIFKKAMELNKAY